MIHGQKNIKLCNAIRSPPA